jgi:NAD(P)-dependent dehydrogenase (short-subunit alcohol dehydrogenase family)
VETNIAATVAHVSEWGRERRAQPDEIAALLSWLASAEASDVNGAVVSADGGWRAV